MLMPTYQCFRLIINNNMVTLEVQVRCSNYTYCIRLYYVGYTLLVLRARLHFGKISSMFAAVRTISLSY